MAQNRLSWRNGYCEAVTEGIDEGNWLCVGCGEVITRPAYCWGCRQRFAPHSMLNARDTLACRLCGKSGELPTDIHERCLIAAQQLLKVYKNLDLYLREDDETF